MNNNICIISPQEQQLRLSRLDLKCPSLISTNASIFYLTGRIFDGYILVRPGEAPHYYVKRPSVLVGENIQYIRKPEDFDFVAMKIGLELGSIPYNDAKRLLLAVKGLYMEDISGSLMQARAVKTPLEQQLMREDGMKQTAVYLQIPSLYHEGMTDIQLQAAIEYESRLEGCLGIFRVHGSSMEIHMGNVLTGDNSDVPSPYDFAMGGQGLSPALPVGASGEEIKLGRAVMVDMNGCFNGYMTDMTRMYSRGELPAEAIKAHDCAVEICHTLATMGKPGVEAKTLYEKAKEIADARDLGKYFMGYRQHAGFVGHGVGIEINELPVIAPRSKNILAEGNVIALEPKFVLPGFGAVGIENTYICTQTGLERITMAPEEIVPLI